MKNLKKYVIALALIMGGIAQSKAQGVGSVDVENGFSSTSTDTTSLLAETLFLGPGTYQIDGTLKVYSKYIWVSPQAVISGSGLIQFFNPSDGGGAASPTYIDGNNVPISVNMELDNAQEMVLVDMTDPGFGSDNVGNASLVEGTNFNMNVDNGDVVLGKIFSDPTSQNTTVANTASTIMDFVFASGATISNYSPLRMVVTSDSIQGHMVAQNYTGSFIFPVGITEGDYTPAQVTNNTANTIHVSVQDYAASLSNEVLMPMGNGMMRTWNIYADNATGSSDINLEHNTITDQSGFNEASHFVTRWSNTTPNTTGDNTLSVTSWQSNTLGAGTLPGILSTTGSVAGSSMRDRVYTDFATSATDAIAFYSKSSSLNEPLPVVLTSFNAVKQNNQSLLQWSTSSEINTNRFVIERSIDNGASWQPIGSVNAKGNSSVAENYSYTDANPSNGTDIYRLSIYDNNGAYTYSGEKALTFENNSPAISIYPNPVVEGEAANLQLSGFQPGNYKLYMLSESGQLLNNTNEINIANTGTVLYPISLDGLSKGSYMIVIEGNGNRIVKKLILIGK